MPRAVTADEMIENQEAKQDKEGPGQVMHSIDRDGSVKPMEQINSNQVYSTEIPPEFRGVKIGPDETVKGGQMIARRGQNFIVVNAEGDPIPGKKVVIKNQKIEIVSA